MDEDHTHGTLGVDPLDRLHQAGGNTPAADRGSLLKADSWRAATMLLQPQHVLRTGSVKERCTYYTTILTLPWLATDAKTALAFIAHPRVYLRARPVTIVK